MLRVKYITNNQQQFHTRQIFMGREFSLMVHEVFTDTGMIRLDILSSDLKLSGLPIPTSATTTLTEKLNSPCEQESYGKKQPLIYPVWYTPTSMLGKMIIRSWSQRWEQNDPSKSVIMSNHWRGGERQTDRQLLCSGCTSQFPVK